MFQPDTDRVLREVNPSSCMQNGWKQTMHLARGHHVDVFVCKVTLCSCCVHFKGSDVIGFDRFESRVPWRSKFCASTAVTGHRDIRSEASDLEQLAGARIYRIGHLAKYKDVQRQLIWHALPIVRKKKKQTCQSRQCLQALPQIQCKCIASSLHPSPNTLAFVHKTSIGSRCTANMYTRGGPAWIKSGKCRVHDLQPIQHSLAHWLSRNQWGGHTVVATHSVQNQFP